MKIPKSYQLADNTIQVKVVDTFHDAGHLGRFFLDRNLVMLQSECEKVDAQRVELTFFHELVHSILLNLNYGELSDDEVFVDRFALLLKQAINSMEYSND